MDWKKRYLTDDIKKDLSQKMVFLCGPRQTGKTALALSLLAECKRAGASAAKGGLTGAETSPAYFNWDFREDRQRLLAGRLPPHEKLLVFDELHKYRRWRGFLKGLYDKHKSSRRFLVTGSGNLKTYNRGGDSLMGRYFFYRLHPFSLRELNPDPTKSDLAALLELSGFPEPLFSGSQKKLKRWRNERLSQFIREDIRDLERVKDLDSMEILMDALPERVGNPLSVKSLREDLAVSHETAERWISVLESLFVCFRIPPFGPPKIRAVKKERKLYLYDWSSIESPGARFENLVAGQLLKYCHFKEDTEGDKMELRFLRDTDKRELDFVVLKNKRPLFAVECKTGASQPAASAVYFQQRTNIPRFYQVHLKKEDYESKEGVRILPFETFCKELDMP